MLTIKEVKYKICLLGDGGVGKTSLIRKFVLDQFDDSYLETFGTKATKKRIKFKMKDESVIDLNLVIWDIMGQREFRNIQMMAYKGTHGALIVCDVTRKDTLFNIPFWQLELFRVTQEIPIIILFNKYDCIGEIQIDEDELNEISKQLNATCFFTSAKTGENVNNAFKEIGRKLILKYMNV